MVEIAVFEQDDIGFNPDLRTSVPCLREHADSRESRILSSHRSIASPTNRRPASLKRVTAPKRDIHEPAK
ncbi:hypothetical protein EVAR_33898_1 [Eumeta japonica]|uniref:Uncharacterized protein n=1 Tax=Eumeta variegata TaxID=151549 RepID=A0A4C1WLY0_EUMVA|nr:hypothetical protein EVAR_33898_1 [Eumeta japonica]